MMIDDVATRLKSTLTLVLLVLSTSFRVMSVTIMQDQTLQHDSSVPTLILIWREYKPTPDSSQAQRGYR